MIESAGAAAVARFVGGAFLADLGEPVPLAGSGFSGAAVFSVRAAAGGERFVLKACAPGLERRRAEWVHRMMRHLRASGLPEVPAVHGARGGGTLVSDPSGTLWELIGFVPGAPVEMPTQAQAEAAMATLARMHLAAAAWPESPPSRGPSPGIDRRIEQARRLLADPWAARRSRLSGNAAEAALPGHGAELRGLFDAAIAIVADRGTRGVGRIARCGPTPVLAQAVIRDIWSDHVLFVGGGDVVGGIIDYHAAGIDTPATDVARLLGSWRAAATGPDGALADRWPTAVAAYERHRPLSPAERRLMEFLHASAVVCGLDHWFRWTLDERRAFGRPDRVLGRIGRLLEELPSALRLLDQADWAGLTG